MVPIEIIWVEPSFNPTIIEGEEITFSIYAIYHNPVEIDTNWTTNDPINGFTVIDTGSGSTSITYDELGEIESSITYTTNFVSNGSNDIKHLIVSFEITDGQNTVAYTWILTVLYFEDADFDGYNDGLEITSNSDPIDPLSTPPDLDNDLILDLNDNDIDGDGFLEKYDSDDTNFNKQIDANPNNSVELLLLFISVVLLIFSFFTLSRVQKYPRR